jgi:hypothetical protein
MLTVSFQTGRTIGWAVPRAIACNWVCTIGSSFGECSVSSSSQSKPALASNSTVTWLDKPDHRPSCISPLRSALLNWLLGTCMSSSRSGMTSYN